MEDLARACRTFLAGAPDDPRHIADIAYGASVRRSHLPHRLALAGSTRAEYLDQLDAFLGGEKRTGMAHGKSASAPPRVAFVCSGQGTQWWGMGRGLLAADPAFRRTMERCHEELSRHASWSLLSFGGFAARAVARILELRGERVDLVALIDANRQWAHPAFPVHQVMARLVAEVLSALARDRQELAALDPAAWTEVWPELASRFEGATWAEGTERLLGWLKDHGLMTGDLTVEAARAEILRHGPYHELIPTFEPRPSAALHVLWWARDGRPAERVAPWEWEAFCTGEVREHVLPGLHHELLGGESVGRWPRS